MEVKKKGNKKVWVALLLLATLVPLGCIMSYAYWEIKKVVEKENYTSMKRTIEDRHVIVEQFLFERMSMLQSFSGGHALADLDTDQKVSRQLKIWRKIYGNFNSLAVVDIEGTAISTAGEDVIDVKNKMGNREAEWFIKAVEKGKYVSPLYNGPDNKPTVAFVTYNISGGQEWLVRSTQGMEPLYDIFKELQHNDSGSYIVDPVTGEYLSKPIFGGNIFKDKNEYFNLGKKHYHKDYDYHGVEEVQIGEYINPRGEEVFEAHCCTRRGSWLIIFEQGKDKVFENLYPLKGKFIMGFSIMAALMISVAMYGVRNDKSA